MYHTWRSLDRQSRASPGAICVRINESWGDVVNWDFIPEKAIDRVSLSPNNPVYGLNAIGGALSIQMKNGFTYQGAETELFGGSYGRAQDSVQAGGQKGQ
jgi:iron complex outermembrane receptor protein